MRQYRGNLASARREVAERRDEVALVKAELQSAQEMMATGGTGPKILSVRGGRRDIPGDGMGRAIEIAWSMCVAFFMCVFLSRASPLYPCCP